MEMSQGTNEKEEELKNGDEDVSNDDIFHVEEIQIEEIAIDGICGVY